MKIDFYKLFYTKKASAGFTLIELLVAMTLTTIVAGFAGFGLVVIMGKNSKAQAETDKRVSLNRALDFISDEVRMASDVNITAPTVPTSWAWSADLDEADPNEGSPVAKLYLQIPWKSVASMTVTGNLVTTATAHELSNGNAVMFTGSGTMPTGLFVNTKYYVRDVPVTTPPTPPPTTFKLSLTVNGSAITLASNSSGALTVNKLIIYLTRDHDNIWLKPRVIKRSVGDCTVDANCDVLIDSIAAESNNGFTPVQMIPLRQVRLQLSGQLSDNPVKNYNVSSVTSARSATLTSPPTPTPTPTPTLTP